MSIWTNIFGPPKPILIPGCKNRAIYCARTAEDHGYPARVRVADMHAEAIALLGNEWWVLSQDRRGRVVFDRRFKGDVLNTYHVETFEYMR